MSADAMKPTRQGTRGMTGSAGSAGSRAVGTAALPDLSSDELAAALDWYAKMVLARRFEEEAEREFRRGKVGGYLHVYSGQEAVAAGFLSVLRSDDIFFTSYRDHAHALFRGVAPGAVMAELFGKATGVATGEGGSMHMFDASRRCARSCAWWRTTNTPWARRSPAPQRSPTSRPGSPPTPLRRSAWTGWISSRCAAWPIAWPGWRARTGGPMP